MKPPVDKFSNCQTEYDRGQEKIYPDEWGGTDKCLIVGKNQDDNNHEHIEQRPFSERFYFSQQPLTFFGRGADKPDIDQNAKFYEREDNRKTKNENSYEIKLGVPQQDQRMGQTVQLLGGEKGVYLQERHYQSRDVKNKRD